MESIPTICNGGPKKDLMFWQPRVQFSYTQFQLMDSTLQATCVSCHKSTSEQGFSRVAVSDYDLCPFTSTINFPHQSKIKKQAQPCTTDNSLLHLFVLSETMMV
jgi:hypothetical protein